MHVEVFSLILQGVMMPLLILIFRGMWGIQGRLSSLDSKVDAAEKREIFNTTEHQRVEAAWMSDRQHVWDRLDKHTDQIADHEARIIHSRR